MERFVKRLDLLLLIVFKILFPSQINKESPNKPLEQTGKRSALKQKAERLLLSSNVKP